MGGDPSHGVQAFEDCTGWLVSSLMHGRRALKQPITCVGLDVHKETIAVGLAETGNRNEVGEYGKIANSPAALKTLAARLGHGGRELRFCYWPDPAATASSGN